MTWLQRQAVQTVNDTYAGFIAGCKLIRRYGPVALGWAVFGGWFWLCWGRWL